MPPRGPCGFGSAGPMTFCSSSWSRVGGSTPEMGRSFLAHALCPVGLFYPRGKGGAIAITLALFLLFLVAKLCLGTPLAKLRFASVRGARNRVSRKQVPKQSLGTRDEERCKSNSPDHFFCCAFSIFAQVSVSATVRLNTGLPGFESTGSAKK